jgi:hypothetical protein
VVKILVSFERGEVTAVISLADAGWLTGIHLAPASAAEPAGRWQPPDHADPAAFSEQDVTVGSGPLAVPGTLSLPRQGGPWPAVVLLSGSGPQDHEETIGRNKQLKDLAWGRPAAAWRRRGAALRQVDIHPVLMDGDSCCAAHAALQAGSRRASGRWRLTRAWAPCPGAGAGTAMVASPRARMFRAALTSA